MTALLFTAIIIKEKGSRKKDWTCPPLLLFRLKAPPNALAEAPFSLQISRTISYSQWRRCPQLWSCSLSFIAPKSGANNSFLGRGVKHHLSIGANCTSVKGRQLWTKPDQVGKERMRESYARDDAVRDLLQLVVRLVVRSWSLRKFSLRSRTGRKLE